MDCATQGEGKLKLVIIIGCGRVWEWEVCCFCDLFEYNYVSKFICLWSCLGVRNRVSSSVSAHICVSCTLLCTSLYWLPIDPAPINTSFFDLCLAICVLPNKQTELMGPFLAVNPQVIEKVTNSLNKVFMPSHLWYHTEHFLCPISPCFI